MDEAVRDRSAGVPEGVRTLEGEVADFAEVVNRHETPLLRYVGRLLNPSSREAEDVVQEAFLRLHRKVEEGGRSCIRNRKTWLFRVAHNLALDVVRKRSRERKFREDVSRDGLKTAGDTVETDNALENLVHREACTMAMAELDKLPEEEKQVVLLRLIEGLSLREIAEITGLTTGNVDYRVNKALREMARRLKTAGIV